MYHSYTKKNQTIINLNLNGKFLLYFKNMKKNFLCNPWTTQYLWRDRRRNKHATHRFLSVTLTTINFLTLSIADTFIPC